MADKYMDESTSLNNQEKLNNDDPSSIRGIYKTIYLIDQSEMLVHLTIH